MPRESPYRILLTQEEDWELRRRAARYTLPYFIVQRAKMILMAAQGMGNDEIAAMMLRAAYQDLSNIEQNIDEKILENIFSRFCIGK